MKSIITFLKNYITNLKIMDTMQKNGLKTDLLLSMKDLRPVTLFLPEGSILKIFMSQKNFMKCVIICLVFIISQFLILYLLLKLK